ncbi:MAG: aminotransferase class I/II-fold pyridoxal phosphate-dependent enzyme [Calditrichaeota bacterium]|nr:MAG: aminotransferase class I/II-fold pyridoxal phosphate-dependent enzyme [Calditrichota bacterium]
MAKSKQLSERVERIRPSGIRKIFDIACANPDGIDLSIGEPDFDIPEPIKEEGIRWIKQGFNGYVSTRGIPELRERLQQELRLRKINFEDVLITAGATGAYYLSILAVVGPGDEVLITDPYFVAYANVVIMCGGTPKFVNTYPDFHLREEAILPLITERTRALVINHPNNPTGAVYSEDELRMVAEIAERYGLQLISDEIYSRFVYRDAAFVSLGQVAPDALVINGFSKSAGMTGWRLGYVSGPRHLIDAMATFQQYSYVCANSIAQKAAVAALDFDMRPTISTYHQRRDLVCEALKERFNLSLPGGAFFVFPEAPGGDAGRFVERAIERKVFIIPGEVFSERNTHFRLSFAVDDEKLKRGLAILNEIADEF